MLACVRASETLDYFEAITGIVYRNRGVLRRFASVPHGIINPFNRSACRSGHTQRTHRYEP